MPRKSKPTLKDACPSCGAEMKKVGKVGSTGEPVSVCHAERKAFRGDVELTPQKTKAGSMYDLIAQRDDPEHALLIEDVALDAPASA